MMTSSSFEITIENVIMVKWYKLEIQQLFTGEICYSQFKCEHKQLNLMDIVCIL